MRKPSINIIAIVFLVIGYQAALFVHRAHVMKAAEKEFVPDTVYVDNGRYRYVVMLHHGVQAEERGAWRGLDDCGDQERLGVHRAVAGPRPLPRHRGGVGVPRVGSSREN